MNANFVKVDSDKIKDSFLKVLERYDALHPFEITLKQTRIKSSTMQAQPRFGWKSIFLGVKRYRIKVGKYVRDSQRLEVEELPEGVLTGWFAHELGHVVDYSERSNFGMIIYGIRYLLSKKFRKQVEHEADYIAIENGFHQEIIATKDFLFHNEMLDGDYRAKIKEYYMSIEEVEMCVSEKTVMKPEVDL